MLGALNLSRIMAKGHACVCVRKVCCPWLQHQRDAVRFVCCQWIQHQRDALRFVCCQWIQHQCDAVRFVCYQWIQHQCDTVRFVCYQWIQHRCNTAMSEVCGQGLKACPSRCLSNMCRTEKNSKLRGCSWQLGLPVAWMGYFGALGNGVCV